MNELQITEYKNIRVLTTQQIAEAYGSLFTIFSSRSSISPYVIEIFGLAVFFVNLITLSSASMTFSNFSMLFSFFPYPWELGYKTAPGQCSPVRCQR